MHFKDANENVVDTFFGVFWCFRFYYFGIIPQEKRGEWDSNPRVLANMGLAIPRPTRLGDPRLIDDLDFLLVY